MRELWNQPVSPDCVVCTSDYTALGVLAACRHELGVDVPDQVGIIGLGDIPIAAWKDNNLTTVKIPHDDLVAKSVEVLIAQIKGAPIGAQLQPFSADIIFRGTTRNI